uniref:Aminotransferase class I/classII large domain-containing protein n=2 Tax=Pinguiococcus pyrenoidosus TaxID=172671 RepID=A0A7R9U8K3_9STRA|mmetsp:Transcript_18459/g.69844  ORF Transcript_18459/g.69844 Transcript_18459/m.69844 type:complete len:523 (+) Transcript_18459:49-1617(+)
MSRPLQIVIMLCLGLRSGLGFTSLISAAKARTRISALQSDSIAEHAYPIDPKEELGRSSVAERLGEKSGPTVWQQMAVLAAQTGALNLGQGYPDWSPPEFVRKAGAQVLAPDAPPGVHQYTRTAGHPRLVNLLAKRYSKHFGRELDGLKEVSVTVGATQALYLCLQTLLHPGDEVLVLEPYFDLYIGQIKASGGVPVAVPLSLDMSEGWRLDTAALERAITRDTRVIIVNTPHNPTGTIFSRAELEAIADIAEKHDLLVISDEVYKFIRFDQRWIASEGLEQKPEDDQTLEHVHFAELSGMWERTMTVSSAGKTFSVTGWQVGWIVAPEQYTSTVHKILPLVQFCAATPLQEALSIALEEAEKPFNDYPNYYRFLQDVYAEKAATLAKALRSAGFTLGDGWGGGGLFLMAEVTSMMHLVPPEYFQEDWTPSEGQAAVNTVLNGQKRVSNDLAFVRFLADQWDILAIPASAFFYSDDAEYESFGALEKRAFIRFAFCKKDETLKEASEKLKAFGDSVKEAADK